MSLPTDRIREIANEQYVMPALKRGDSHIVIRVKDLLMDLYQDGFPAGRTPMVCSALRGKKFLNEHNLELERTEGPPSGQSTTVIYHYRHQGHGNINAAALSGGGMQSSDSRIENDPLLGLRGTLKGAFREGAEAFLRELRKDPKENYAVPRRDKKRGAAA